jgi:hypothetical protein
MAAPSSGFLWAGAVLGVIVSFPFGFLWLNGGVRVSGCGGGRGGLVRLQGAPLWQLAMAHSVSPAGPNGCRAPAPVASIVARASLPPRRPKWPGSLAVVRWPERSDSVGGLVEARRT